jgi:hypothetical protein
MREIRISDEKWVLYVGFRMNGTLGDVPMFRKVRIGGVESSLH